MTDLRREIEERSSALEDNFTERKPDSAKASELRKTLVAFANSVPEGSIAILYIGISDNGEIRGVRNPDKKQKTIREICEKQCYPPIKFQSIVSYKNHMAYVAIAIQSSNERPHFAGPAYVRIGSESIVASEEMFSELIARRLHKCHEILKWKDKIIKITALGKRLGNTKRVSSGGYRASGDFLIEECNPYYIVFSNADTGKLSEPLGNVNLTWDVARDRLMLIVREPPT